MNYTPATIIIALAFIIGIAYGGTLLSAIPSLKRSLFKTAPVSLLAISAWVSGAPVLLVIALGLSAAGDAFLSKTGEKMFLAGLGSFLLAHLIYVALFINHPGDVQPTGLTLLAVAVVTIALIALVLKSLWSHLGAMKIPVVFYTLIIGAMNMAAWHSGQTPFLLIAVALFVFSDMVLSHELFVWQEPARKKLAAYTVWFSYLMAQTMITLSFISL